MQYLVSDLTPGQVYKLMCSMIVPRPIAFVTSLGDNGAVNAAPFSFFNTMGYDPPVVAIGIGDRGANLAKDTARNIKARGEFVVNMVDEALSQRMNLSATNFPPDVSEVDALALETAPSTLIAPPRLAESPFSFECRHVSTVEIGKTRIVLGQILAIWGRDALLDTDKLYVLTEQANLVARMHGSGWYTRTNELFEMSRMSFEEWKATKEG